VLYDLAALERALNDAFDGKDGPVVTLADMAGFSRPRRGPIFGSGRTRPPARLDVSTNASADLDGAQE